MLKTLQISTHLHSHSGQQFQPPAIPANSSMSNLSRQRPDAEVDFLQQTPWANPQHPVHHQITNTAHRQVSHHSRPHSPFVTPTTHRQNIDNSRPNGTASTTLDPTSIHGFSIVPTPSSMDAGQPGLFSRSFTPYTPSKSYGATHEKVVVETSPKSGALEKGLAKAPLITNSPIILDAISPTGAGRHLSEPPQKSHQAGLPHQSPGALLSSPFKLSSPRLHEVNQTHRPSSLLGTRSSRPIGAGLGLDSGRE